MSKNAQRYSKKQRQDVAPEKPVKFVEANVAKVKLIVPKTNNQGIALDMLKRKQLCVLGGEAGTGKTFLATTHAANEYLKGNAKQIILIRPAEPLGKTIGFKPGLLEKLKPLMQTMLDDIEYVVGKGELQAMIEYEKLILESLEDCRGRSYKQSVVVVDEAQNASVREMKALLTRMEESSQLILCGDWRQADLKGDSGLKWMYDRLDYVRRNRPDYLDTDDMNEALTNIGTVLFQEDDIVRSGLTKFWVKVFNNSKD